MHGGRGVGGAGEGRRQEGHVHQRDAQALRQRDACQPHCGEGGKGSVQCEPRGDSMTGDTPGRVREDGLKHEP